MIDALLRPALGCLPLGWIAATPCPICRRPQSPRHSPLAACTACRATLQLAHGGLQGRQPLPWWGAGAYAGDLRQLLLGLRRHPREAPVGALVQVLVEGQPCWRLRPLLVPIPSWKRRGNPLPPLLCRQLSLQLGFRSAELLERRRPVLGQHHLNLSMRLANQEGSFLCRRRPRPGQPQRLPILLVDDILTSGATGSSAALCLEEAGWHVVGLLCLARTPRR